jgi:hypothetical protein
LFSFGFSRPTQVGRLFVSRFGASKSVQFYQIEALFLALPLPENGFLSKNRF